MKQLPKLARRNRLTARFPWWSDFREDWKVFRKARKWRSEGWLVPLPGLIKRAIIKAEARAFGATVLVETGTYLGDTLWFFRHDFQRMYSIEVQPELARLARERFAGWPGVTIIEGDSARCLTQIIPTIQDRCVYWLDGHYSAGITGRGSRDCPIWEELEAIVKHMKAPVLILIDDARCFGVDKDYPTTAEIAEYVARKLPEYSLSVGNDIIRIAPSGSLRVT